MPEGIPAAVLSVRSNTREVLYPDCEVVEVWFVYANG